jgi:hypothetical protein
VVVADLVNIVLERCFVRPIGTIDVTHP